MDRTVVPEMGRGPILRAIFSDLSIESTRCPDVSKKPEKFDRLLWFCKQFQESRVKEYFLPPCLLRFKDPDIFEFLPRQKKDSTEILIAYPAGQIPRYAFWICFSCIRFFVFPSSTILPFSRT
jgi:hypothetical protein